MALSPALSFMPDIGRIAALFTIAGTGLVLYTASVAIYRLFFHPLAKFPGPKLAALSRWYECYQEIFLRGQFYYSVEQMHEKYGRHFTKSHVWP